MATYKSGRGPRGGDHRRREGWPGSRDYRSGSSSPGPRRTNTPWHNNYRADFHKEHRDSHRVYVQYLLEQWKKVEQDLNKEPSKDTKITETVEYVEKRPTDVKVEDLFDMVRFLKNREQKTSPPD